MPDTPRLVVFIVVSAAILALSWRSLRNPRSHGFFRFFAAELILVLILLNAEAWFRQPFALHQLISWLLLVGSLLLAVHAFSLFRLLGKAAAPPPGSSNVAFENTTQLITVCAYRYIRHPMYSSLLLLAWGAFLKDVTVLTALSVLVASVFLYATARVEEKENIERFGDAYESYMKNTKMFIPFLL